MLIMCPHCGYYPDRTEDDPYPETFYVLPLQLVQESCSGWKKDLYACPICGKAFVSI